MHHRPLTLLALSSAVIVFGALPASSAGALSAAARMTARAGSSGAVLAADEPDIARDVSFPQCGGGLPGLGSADFGVLGTNNGASFTRNPCLTAELGWAKRLESAPAFYANTGNPGPNRARVWPRGQSSPRQCFASAPNSLGCSYDYGWNAAWHSYSVATDAAQLLHHVSRANARARAANVDWWLDVETMNSWQSKDGAPTSVGQRLDVATLEGEVDALRAAGVARVGVYSTVYQWTTITGGSRGAGSRLAGLPQWLAGYSSRAGAIGGCGQRGFTGGPVRMTQYLGRDGFDADVICNTAGI